MIDSPHVYFGAYALCLKDEHMLLARIGPGRYETGRWALPGGGVNSTHYIGILYFVETLPGELRHEQAGSTDQCAWFPLEDLTEIPMVDVAKFGVELVQRLRLQHGPAASDEFRDFHGTLPRGRT